MAYLCHRQSLNKVGVTVKPIRILIVDDHKIIRVGLRGLFQLQPDMTVVGEAETMVQAIELTRTTHPQVVVMDIDLEASSGIEATRQIKQIDARINVLALTLHRELSYIKPMLEAGACGYVLKNAEPEELTEAVRAVAKGNSYLTAAVSETILKSLTNPSRQHREPDGLTPREVEVLALIAQELSNAEIADKLFVSVRTVDTHRRNLLDKLNAKNTAGLVKYAIARGLV